MVKEVVLHVNSSGGASSSSSSLVADVGDVGNVQVAVAPGNLLYGRPIPGGVFHHPQCAQVRTSWCILPLKYCLAFRMRVADADAGGCCALCRGIGR